MYGDEHRWLANFPNLSVETKTFLSSHTTWKSLADITSKTVRGVWLTAGREHFRELVQLVRSCNRKFLDCDPFAEDLLGNDLSSISELSPAGKRHLEYNDLTAFALLGRLRERDLKGIKGIQQLTIDQIKAGLERAGLSLQP